MPSAPLASLRAEARAAAAHAHVPFSGQAAAAALLLSDGAWVPGVRVESASFSLTIPPALNAFTTAVAAGRRDVVAAAFSRPVQRVERAFLEGITPAPLRSVEDDVCAVAEASMPSLETALNPRLPADPPSTPREGVALARSVAEGALVPASHFPVGGVLSLGDALVPGVNVEPPSDAVSTEWSHVLCAERSALGTACTYGLLGDGASKAQRAPQDAPTPPSDVETGDESIDNAVLYLSCPEDPGGSPCGACRQLLVELLPRGVLWMDRASAPPERVRLTDLLPGSFRGAALTHPAPEA